MDSLVSWCLLGVFLCGVILGGLGRGLLGPGLSLAFGLLDVGEGAGAALSVGGGVGEDGGGPGLVAAGAGWVVVVRGGGEGLAGVAPGQGVDDGLVDGVVAGVLPREVGGCGVVEDGLGGGLDAVDGVGEQAGVLPVVR